MSSGPLIAIVDDDHSAREAIMSLVRALGFDAAAFTGAAHFLASDSLDRTACLITDMWMTPASGLDLHRELVARGHDIPTILVTAYPDEPTRARAERAGIHAFLPKPLAPEPLLAALRRALGQ